MNKSALWHNTLSALILSGAILGCTVSQQSAPEIDIFHGGLEKVSAREFDAAYVLPGADFKTYRAVLIDSPDLAFLTPDRSQQQFPLTEAQKARFRDLLATRFGEEISSSSALSLAEESGPDVLRLKIRVQDISATVLKTGIGNAGLASIALQAAGKGMLVLELRDSQSEQILAKSADTLETQGVAILQPDAGAVTSWKQVEAICADWAVAARKGLERLVAR